MSIEAVNSILDYDKKFPTMSFTAAPFFYQMYQEKESQAHKVISSEACNADR